MSGNVLTDIQALDGLAGEVGYHIEVLVEMQDRESGEFRGSRDDQVRYRRRPVLASVGEQGQDLDRPVLEWPGSCTPPASRTAAAGQIRCASPGLSELSSQLPNG